MSLKDSMERKNRRRHGEVFTDKNVVHYILDETGYISSKNLRDIKLLEPSSGKGAFAGEIIKRLFESSKKHHFSFHDSLLNNIRFVELDPTAHEGLVASINETFEYLTSEETTIGSLICLQADFLSHEFTDKFDCIVGNPPYIRHELISEENKKAYRNRYETFKFRADLYIPFFEQSLKLLAPNGILSFICSNRWLYNQYGANLRELISSRYNLIRLLNIEKSSPFDEEVIAYPCITTTANNKDGGKTFVGQDDSKKIDFNNLSFKQANTPIDSSWQNLFLTYDINHDSLVGLPEQGFEIGIGVATGADKIFIKKRSELNGIERSRLIPLIKSTDLRNNTFKWHEQFVINPYEKGKLCDLEQYPHLKEYLTEYKETLLKRHTAQKSPDKWYKTIDKIKPELQRKPKLLLPDLTGNNIIFIDEGEFYPHHNIYYITGKDIDSLKLLASILMSDFCRSQISQIGIKMNGGMPRFQAQILKRIKIPHIENINSKDRSDLMISYELRDLDAINRIIRKYCAKQRVYDMG